MISRSLIILAVVGYSCAALWIGELPQKPEELAHKEGCYVAEINDVIPFHTDVTPIGVCYRISCEKRFMEYASCGLVHASGNCYKVGEDKTKAYPECCATFKCEEENTI